MSFRQLKRYFSEQALSVQLVGRIVCHLHNSDTEYCISQRQSQGEACIMKIQGPKIEPWRITHLMGAGDEEQFPNLSEKVLSLR